MDLSAVIVNWNSGPHLNRLLGSLGVLSEELAEVLVVDNASTDKSPEAVAAFPRVRLLRMVANLGFAGAANHGIALTKARIVLLLNPDLELNPEGVRSLYEEMNRRPTAAIVSGELTDKDGIPQSDFQIRPLPTGWSVIRDVLFLDELLRGRARQSRAPETPIVSTTASMGPEDREIGPEDREIEVEQPAAAFWLLRREAWEAVGGFDEQFQPAWFEDVDFCKRVRATQWQIFHFPGHSAAIHHGGLALDRLGYQRFVGIYYSNLLRYLKKHHRTGYPFLWPAVQAGSWIRRLIISGWR